MNNVIFLAYAPSKTSELPSLQDEAEQVYSSLAGKLLSGMYFVHRERYATVENINKYLGEFRNRVMIFLYSGHADDEQLLFNDQQVNSEGLARQLKESADDGVLKLVVLNGCSTAGQVQKLLENNVPVVIATSSPVNDESSKEFAVRFFKNLAEKRMTIKASFDDAIGAAQFTSKVSLSQDGTIIPVRDLGFAKSKAADTPLWEIFSAKPEDVEWTPPLPRYTGNFQTNEKLAESIYQTLLQDDSLKIKMLEESRQTIPDDLKMVAIISCFPFPVATHLQKLFTPIDNIEEGFDKPDRRRLEEIGELYQSTAEFMAIIMLSQLWEVVKQKKITDAGKQVKEVVRKYCTMQPRERSTYDYIPLIRTIRQYFDTLESVDYFVTELKDLKEKAVPGNAFGDACSALHALRTQTIQGGIQEADVLQTCIQAENNLCDFFASLGFMHKYVLSSVQVINTLKYRHETEPLYNHKIFQLMQGRNVKAAIYYNMLNYLDTTGIVLIKQELERINATTYRAQTVDFINLSPFYIDRTAFEQGTVSNLMVFSSYQQHQDNTKTFQFRKVSNPSSVSDTLPFTSEEPYQPIRLQFEFFEQLLQL